MAYEVVNAADLPQETSTTLDGTEQLIGFDTAQGKRITVAELAEYILQRKLSSLAGSSQTVAAALAALNSNFTEIKSVALSSPNLSPGAGYKKTGYVVMFVISNFINLTPNVWTTIENAVLPKPHSGTITFDIKTSGNINLRIQIQSDGTIRVYNYSSDTRTLNTQAVITYISSELD